jgi:hypothetical protein
MPCALAPQAGHALQVVHSRHIRPFPVTSEVRTLVGSWGGTGSSLCVCVCAPSSVRLVWLCDCAWLRIRLYGFRTVTFAHVVATALGVPWLLLMCQATVVPSQPEVMGSHCRCSERNHLHCALCICRISTEELYEREEAGYLCDSMERMKQAGRSPVAADRI